MQSAATDQSLASSHENNVDLEFEEVFATRITDWFRIPHVQGTISDQLVLVTAASHQFFDALRNLVSSKGLALC